MRKEWNISIYTENWAGLLARITLIFTRRNINISSLTVSESEIPDISRFTIVVHEEEQKIERVVKQIEKQVDVFKAAYFSNEEMVYQEVALYKLPVITAEAGTFESIIREHHARILSICSSYVIIEKTGHEAEVLALFDQLEGFGLLEFVRSGRVAVAKVNQPIHTQLKEKEVESNQLNY